MGLDVFLHTNCEPTDHFNDADFKAYVLNPKWDNRISTLIKDQWYISDFKEHYLNLYLEHASPTFGILFSCSVCQRTSQPI